MLAMSRMLGMSGMSGESSMSGTSCTGLLRLLETLPAGVELLELGDAVQKAGQLG
jgi:hypothetical protein